MSVLSIRLPEELDRQLQEEANRMEKSRSELVRDIVAEYLIKQEKARFMAEVVAAAKALAENPEAVAESLEIAEDFLPLENEALDLAEGRKPGDSWPEETEGKWWK